MCIRDSQYSGPERQYLREIAAWDDYKLTQANAHGFLIEKRTQAQSSWLRVTEGKRALGLAFLGDVTGGLAVDCLLYTSSLTSAIMLGGLAISRWPGARTLPMWPSPPASGRIPCGAFR